MINKALSLCFHSLLLLIVFNSALKYIYAVNLWNMLQLFLALCLIVLGSIYKDIVYRGVNFRGLIFILFISFSTSLSFFYPLALFDMSDIFKFITLTIFMFSGLYFAQYLNVLTFAKVINVFTFAFILIFDFLKLMKMDPNANYLMYSMAISFVCVANFGLSYFRGGDFKWLIIGGILVLYCLTLHSRSAIIFPILFLMFFIFCYCLKENKMLKLFISILIVFALGVLVFSLYDVTIEDFSSLGYGAYKLVSMFDGGHMSGRTNLLGGSLQAISTNPFGYGLGSHNILLGYYPHNFFLEVSLNFGLFVCFIYIMLLIIAIYELYKADEIKTYFFSLLYLYYLAIWMTSFNYLSSFQIHFALGGLVSCLFYKYKTLGNNPNIKKVNFNEL